MRQQTCKKEELRQKNVIHCACCHTMYSGDEGWTVFQPKTRKTPAYMCPDCMKVTKKRVDTIRYSSYNHNIEYGIGVELIGVPHNNPSHALMLSEDYQFIAEKSSKDSIRYKSLYYPNFHGVKAVCRAFSENIEPTDRAYVKIAYKPEDKMDTVDNLENKVDYKLIESIEKYITTVPDTNIIGKLPKKWITVKNNVITFEGKFLNAKQFFWYTNLCRDLLQVFTGEKILKRGTIEDIFDKYAEGRANCQRPERNSW